MHRTYPLFALALLTLAGCSSAPRVPEYVCPLQTSERAKCATMSEALHASKNLDPSSRTQSAFDPAAQSAPSPTSQTPAAFSQNPQTLASNPNGAPVFAQPKVFRTWVPAHQGADGVLYADQYKYFSTPGQWNYGTLRKPGAAAGAPFEPARPLTRGANVVDQPTSQTRTTPATTTPRTTSPNGVTQPTQTIQTPGAQPSATNVPDAAASPQNISVPRTRFSTN